MRQTAETLIIAAMLNTGDPGVAASVGVRPEHFSNYRDEYRWVNKYFEEYGGAPTREQLTAKFPGFPRLDREIRDLRQPVRDLSREHARKMLMRAMSEASTDLMTDDVETAYKRISGLSLETFTPPPENLLASDSFLDDYEDIPPAIPFPWPTLQAKTGGMLPEQLMYFAARPSQGKSFYLTKIAAEAAFMGFRVLFYSLEMSKRELQVRSHAILGNKIGWGDQINTFEMLHRQYSKTNYQLLLRELGEKTEGVLHIQDQTQGRITPSVVASRASEYDLTIVDYVGLMGSDNGSGSFEDWRVAAGISNELKSIAKGKKTRILAAAQINRAGDSDGRPVPPAMKDLGGTDAYVQDADTIVTMTRMRGGHAAVLSNEKNRSGIDKARFYTKYLANQGDFDEITRAAAEDLCDEMDD